jgi:hypothetical protein
MSLASASVVGFSLAGLQPLAPRLPLPPASLKAELPAEAARPVVLETHVGVIVALEPVEEPPDAPREGRPRPHRVTARMQDGSMRRALLSIGPGLQLGDSVRGAGGTLVARELYRSAPFVPVRERG